MTQAHDDDKHWHNVHEVIGWFTCANLTCRRDLTGREGDYVVLLTTTQMRRFCTVDCIAEGQDAWHDFIYTLPLDSLTLGRTHGELLQYLKSVPSHKERDGL